jgi:hypothetical protein
VWEVTEVLRYGELAAKVVREISRDFTVVAIGEFFLVLAVCLVVGFGLQLLACFCVGENKNKSAREAHLQVRGGGASTADRRARPGAALPDSAEPHPDLTLASADKRMEQTHL